MARQPRVGVHLGDDEIAEVGIDEPHLDTFDLHSLTLVPLSLAA